MFRNAFGADGVQNQEQGQEEGARRNIFGENAHAASPDSGDRPAPPAPAPPQNAGGFGQGLRLDLGPAPAFGAAPANPPANPLANPPANPLANPPANPLANPPANAPANPLANAPANPPANAPANPPANPPANAPAPPLRPAPAHAFGAAPAFGEPAALRFAQFGGAVGGLGQFQLNRQAPNAQNGGVWNRVGVNNQGIGNNLPPIQLGQGLAFGQANNQGLNQGFNQGFNQGGNPRPNPGGLFGNLQAGLVANQNQGLAAPNADNNDGANNNAPNFNFGVAANAQIFLQPDPSAMNHFVSELSEVFGPQVFELPKMKEMLSELDDYVMRASLSNLNRVVGVAVNDKKLAFLREFTAKIKGICSIFIEFSKPHYMTKHFFKGTFENREPKGKILFFENPSTIVKSSLSKGKREGKTTCVTPDHITIGVINDNKYKGEVKVFLTKPKIWLIGTMETTTKDPIDDIVIKEIWKGEVCIMPSFPPETRNQKLSFSGHAKVKFPTGVVIKGCVRNGELMKEDLNVDAPVYFEDLIFSLKEFLPNDQIRVHPEAIFSLRL